MCLSAGLQGRGRDASGRRCCDRPKQSKFSVVFPGLQHMLSRYRTPLCSPPTANIDSSPQRGQQNVASSTRPWQQPSACTLSCTVQSIHLTYGSEGWAPLILSQFPVPQWPHFWCVPDNAALRFINQYWPAFYKELLPFAAQGWDEFLRGILNKLFLQVPFDTIFPEN
jgi:hypothetical protein